MNALDAINTEAARWHARSNAGLSAHDEQRLDAWLDADLKHRLAFAEVAAAGFALQQAGMRAASALRASVHTHTRNRQWPAWLAGAVAAPLLLALALSLP